MDEKLKMELKHEVESVVAAIFSEKEEADIRKKTESALQESAEKLQEITTCLEERNEEVSSLTTKITESEGRIQSLESELEAAKKETEEANSKISEAEAALEDIKKDREAELRIAELSEAKVIGTDKEAQLVKVREMSNDEFAAYRDERIALRKAVIDELALASSVENTVVEDTVVVEETASDTTVEIEEETEDDDVSPANVDPGQAIAAALNMEVRPTSDMVNKYRELGKSMAALMTKKQEIEV